MTRRICNGVIHMKNGIDKFIKGIGAALLMAALASCGGSSLNSGASSTPSSGSSTTGQPVGTSLVELGSGVGATFNNKALAVQVANLSAGGTTTITATIVDANNSNALYTAQSITITFSSNCVSSGLAALSQSSVTTSNGQASVNYTAKGCSGSDPITATALVGSSTLNATGTVSVQPATVGSIQFIAANPSLIALQGVGGVTSSQVTFQVNDSNGNPIQNATVDFTLSTTAGGISLSPATAVTGTNGQASTFVQSGTVHTSVNVIATVANTSIATETPNAIAVSTGIPVQTHFSIALATHNVSLAYDHDGITDSVTVHAADRYGNPPPTGTNILFTTNSGTIDGSCATDSTGACSVTWTSAGNRPANDALDVLGHVHILAYTAGEEHYTDNNSDNVFDNGDTFSKSAAGDDQFDGLNEPGADDIGDPYLDSKETGAYIFGEPYFNVSNNGSLPRRSPDGKWYGSGCGGFGSNSSSVSTTGGAVTCANALTMIGREDCLVESTDAANVTGPSVSTVSAASIPAAGTPVTFTVEDTNGNVIGSGSTVSIVSVNVSGVVLALSPASGTNTTSFTQADAGCGSGGPQTFVITVTKSSSATSFGGSFYLQYTSSDGKTSSPSGPVTITP